MPDRTSDTAVATWTMGSLATPRPESAATDPLSTWAKLGLTGLLLALITPLVAFLGTWTAALLGQLAAAGLETSRAELPFIAVDADWDLRLIYVAALATLALRMIASTLPRPTWKIAGLGPWSLWLVLGAGLWLTAGATLVLERHVLDLADGLHLVLLGATALWTAATALWLAASIGHAILVGLRIAARRSSIAASIIAVTGIASMAVATPVLANPEIIEGSDVYRDSLVLGAVAEDLRDSERMLEANMAAEPPASRRDGFWFSGSGSASKGEAPALLTPSSSDPSSPTEGGTTVPPLPPQAESTNDPNAHFASCMESLVDSGAGSDSSIRATVTRKLRSKYSSIRHEVDELVRWKMIDVCSDGRERTQDQLSAYLYTLARNAVVSRIRKLGAQARDWASNRCIIDGTDDEITTFEEHQHREATIAALLDGLSSQRRVLIEERYLDGLTYEEMAERHDKTKSAVARATNYALHDLREQAARSCPR